MRQEDSEFNVKNHFHFSPPTIERFILFLVNDTLHYRALYDLLCAAERTPRFLQIPTIPSFSPSHVFPALESKGPCLKSQVLHYLGVVEDYKRFTTLGHYLKNVHWKKTLKRVPCLRLSSWWGVVAHIADLMENKPKHVGHNLCCIVSTFHSLR